MSRQRSSGADRLEELALAALEHRDRLTEAVLLGMLRGTVRLVGLLVLLDLEKEEHLRVLRVASRLVEEVPRLGGRERGGPEM